MAKNEMTSDKLLELINEEFGSKQITLKKLFKALPEFNHSQKIKAILDELVEDGNLTLEEDKYKVVSNYRCDTRKFVSAFAKHKKLGVPTVRLELALRKKMGNVVTSKTEALDTVKKVLAKRKAFVNPTCPRCGNAMVSATLANNKKALYCKNDRVCIPVKA